LLARQVVGNIGTEHEVWNIGYYTVGKVQGVSR